MGGGKGSALPGGDDVVVVVVVFVICGRPRSNCTGCAVGGGAGEAPLPSRIESDISKSGVYRGRMAWLGRERSEASPEAEALFPLRGGSSMVTSQSKPVRLEPHVHT